MKNLQFAEVLRSLTKEEFRDFGRLVNSPYFNNRNEVVRFFNAFKKFYPRFDQKNFTEEYLFALVYPGRKFSNTLMRKLISLTISLAMDLYSVQSFKENRLDYNIKLLYTLYGKNLPSLFEKKAKNMEKLLDSSKHTIDYYEAKSKFTGWMTAHLLNKNESATVPKFQNELNDLVEYFLVAMLMNYNRLTTYSKMYNINYELKFFNEVTEFLVKNDYNESTLVAMYHNLVMLSKTEEERYFTGLNKFWEKSQNKLSNLHLYIIYVALYNYCINRRQKGEMKYQKIQFDITKKYFVKNLFPREMGYIQANLFSAAVINASQLKEFEWIEDFIMNYQHLLDPLTKNETVCLCNAVTEFEKGNYGKSLSHLSVIKPERLNRKMIVKNLVIMNYYELNHPDEFESTVDAYKHFLQRTKDVTPQQQEMNVSFLKFISRAAKLRNANKYDEIGILSLAAERAPYFTNKEWVLQKIMELNKGGS